MMEELLDGVIPLRNTSFLYRYIKDDMARIIGVVVVVIFFVFFNLTTPLIIGFVIDNVIGNIPITNGFFDWFTSTIGGLDYLRENLWICAILLLGVQGLSGIGMYYRGKWNGYNSENIAKRLRDDLFHHLQLLPYKYHVSAKTGDLIQRCTNDVDQIRRFFAAQISEITYSIATASVAIVILFSIYPRLAIYAVLSMPVLAIFAYIFFKRMQSVFRKSDEEEGELSTIVQENVSGMRVVKAFHQERNEIDKFEKKNRSYSDYTYEMVRLLGIYWGASDLICLLQILAVVLLGIYFSVMSDLSLGSFFIFVSYEGMILWPVRQLGRILADAGKMSVSIERLMEIINETPEDMVSGKEVKISGQITFQDVVFRYDDEPPVLNGITLSVQAGESIAIMGPTGSGKSSLVHLLTRLYDYQSGSITLDGIELKEIAKANLRKQVGIVLQEPFLFSKTIRENIAIAKRNFSDKDIYHAAEVASVHQVISEFDQGYETAVGERGVTLSGGQKQRIAIARTIINETPIMIFDDSLSAVDTDTDAAIRDALKHLHTKPTMFIITHRVTSAMQADKIVVLEDGKITQMGRHDDLIVQDGLYARIASIQQAMVDGGEVHE